MHDDLVQKPRLETLPGDAGTEDDHIRSIGRVFRERHCILDTQVDELPGHAHHDRGIRRRIVAQYEERAAIGAAVEAWLEAILDILRAVVGRERS